MDSFHYIILVVLLCFLFLMLQRQKLAVVKNRIKNKKGKERLEMLELAKRFIGKECVISSFDGNHNFDGIIKEVSNGAVLIEKDGKLEAINLDYVIRIREYPLNKKGKKRAIV